MASPLLSIGTFGTHIISNPYGWSFAGTSPVDLKGISYATEAEAIAAFVSWFKAQDVSFRREHVANLRNDVYAAVLSA